MSEEVKRYDLVFTPTGRAGIDVKPDGRYVPYANFQSERQARLEAETKLRELQDAIDDLENAHQVDKKCSPKNWKVMLDAIQESRSRQKDKTDGKL